MQKDIKLYNVMFPIWFLIVFPIAWIIILPVNFIIDSLVLLISARVLKLTNLKGIYKKSILKIWMIGFGADFIGAGILFLSTTGSGVWYEYLNAVSWNPFDNWYAILFVTFATAVTGILIYFGNLKLVFQGMMDIEQRNKKLLALALAVFTAPYVFFYPSALINGGSWDQLDFLTNHIVKSSEFRLEADPGTGSSQNPMVLYDYQSEIKDAINTAEKISNDSAMNSQPDYTFYFYNRDYTERKEIPLWLENEEGYFRYQNNWYILNQQKFPTMKEMLEDIQETKGKKQFKLIPEPETAKAGDPTNVDKEGKRKDSYSIFETSKSLYYFPDKDYFYTAVIQFEGMEQMDLYVALEKGLVSPQELIDYGMALTEEARNQ